MTTPTIVVGLDGSESARRAARAAAAWGERAGARLVLVGVRTPSPPVGAPVLPRGALRAALLGSVVTELLMDATVPVLAVPAQVDRTATRSVVCGVPDTAEATLAATAAARVAELFDAALVLVHVLERDGAAERAYALLADVAAALDTTAEVERLVRTGSVAEQLTTVADERGSALIAVGSRGRGPARTLLLGSTTRDVLATGRHALLATPPRAVDHVLTRVGTSV